MCPVFNQRWSIGEITNKSLTRSQNSSWGKYSQWSFTLRKDEGQTGSNRYRNINQSFQYRPPGYAPLLSNDIFFNQCQKNRFNFLLKLSLLKQVHQLPVKDLLYKYYFKQYWSAAIEANVLLHNLYCYDQQFVIAVRWNG